MSCEMETPPFIRYDDLWSTCEGATPIVEVAVRQRLVNIDLVLLHLQLAQVLQLMAVLEIKGVHPLSLFDQRAVWWIRFDIALCRINDFHLNLIFSLLKMASL